MNFCSKWLEDRYESQEELMWIHLLRKLPLTNRRALNSLLLALFVVTIKH